MAIENRLTTGHVLLSIIYVLMLPALFLLISGDLFWLEGWIFIAWLMTIFISTIIYLYQKDPALLVERFRRPGTGNEKVWDVYLYYLLVILFAIWIIIMPLDAKRYEWTTNFPFFVKFFGFIALLKSFFFIYRSFTDNTFLSPLVRIQTERNQQVVSTGVYGFVRHPMYLGAILLFIGTPMLLGSKYGVFISIIMSFTLVVRIFGEEKMLVEELAGYEDYKNQVKYRLIPFIW
ncbi:putative protein-S-isoprenylcysteine methyltransferase [Calothrix sp. NIES-4071]|nr:putative protein-S-isoprenylcysteine methyltransferase [Calothrix sp. NIES-4071]BAZ61071.1 putative protein-S-isoprenylcysteine methyltransferase [Calothrix sp. NIES-4105]